MLVMIGITDLTKYIEDGSYDVDSEEIFKEWQDGNYVNHRDVFRERVKGSFNIICSDKTISVSDLNTLISSNKTNGKVTMLLHVENKGELQAINCFCTTKAKHSPSADIVTVTVEEA